MPREAILLEAPPAHERTHFARALPLKRARQETVALRAARLRQRLRLPPDSGRHGAIERSSSLQIRRVPPLSPRHGAAVDRRTRQPLA